MHATQLVHSVYRPNMHVWLQAKNTRQIKANMILKYFSEKSHQISIDTSFDVLFWYNLGSEGGAEVWLAAYIGACCEDILYNRDHLVKQGF